jgi:hypothetical protein
LSEPWDIWLWRYELFQKLMKINAPIADSARPLWVFLKKAPIVLLSSRSNLILIGQPSILTWNPATVLNLKKWKWVPFTRTIYRTFLNVSYFPSKINVLLENLYFFILQKPRASWSWVPHWNIDE